MSSLRIPLVGSLTDRNPNASLNDTTDQQFINCFPEVVTNRITQKSQVVLNKRQGSIASADVQASATGQYGAIVWTTNSAVTAPLALSFLKSTSQSMMFFNESGVQHGADVPNTAGCPFMSETDISGTGNLTAVLLDYPTAALEAWYFPQGGAWTQITDGDFPTNITAGHAHMDGYMFVMTDAGRIYNSDLNTLSSWTASSFITLSGGGNGIGLARHRDLIVGFSDYSTEFFYNAGNASGSVLSRARDGLIRIGAARGGATQAPSFRAIGDSVYWIGQNADSGKKGVYRLKGAGEGGGAGAEKISNSTVDRIVNNGGLGWIAGSFSMFGMTHVAFSTGSSGHSCLCYCVDTGYWWVFLPAGTLTILAMLGAVNVSGYSKSYMTTATNAKFYTFDSNAPVWQDNGSAYTMTVQTGADDLDTYKKKYYRSLKIIGDSQTSTSAIGVSYSDDDFATFTSAGSIDMNTVPPPRLSRLGASRRRAWKVTHSANTPCRIAAMQLDFDQGTS